MINSLQVSLQMARTTKVSRQIAASAKRTRKLLRRAALDDICVEMHEASRCNGNKLPYGYVMKLLNELAPTSDLNWLTRNIINKAFLRYKKDHRSDPRKEGVPDDIQITANGSILSDISGMNTSRVQTTGAVAHGTEQSETDHISASDGDKKSKGGRPTGSTNASKQNTERCIVEAKNEIAQRFAACQRKRSKGGRIPKGTLNNIIKEVCDKRNLKETILPNGIRQRFYRKKLTIRHKPGQISPLDRIEPTIIRIILQMARIRQSISPSRGLRLINSLIDNMPIQEELIEWKRKYSNDTLGTVGIGYWNRFIRRHKDKLVTKRGQKYELNRQNWTTYTNFVNMYSHVEQEMENMGLATKLDNPVWMDRYGQVVTEEKAFGCKVAYRLTHPHMCIVGDEVGGNLCMKGDGHAGGQLFLTAPGRVPQQKASSKNRRFTLIGLTALSGEPVMCVIILEGKNPKASIEAGIDINVQPVGDVNDEDFVQNNSGPGKYYPGGAVCEFNGKKIPPFVRWHESGSITSEILKEALQTLDHLNIFNRDECLSPLLLLDGHSSRLELPFLQYINNPKDHWVTCIGVPYGTALWQVGDSKEQNGSFNIGMTKAKQKLIEKKECLGLPPSLVDTDLMVLINSAWSKSFARRDKNIKAIADRGWNPLNRALLLDQDLRATMTRQEKMKEKHHDSNIILPSTNASDDCTQTTVTISTAGDDELNNQNERLNFNHGTAAFCIDAIVSHGDLQKARERIKSDHLRGKSIKEKLEAAKRVTSGIVFASGTSRLGKTVFDVCKENQERRKAEIMDKIKKEEAKYQQHVKEAHAVFDKKSDINKMTIKELTTICKPLKRKGDGKMPTKKASLIAKYREWNGRPVPLFDYTTIQAEIVLNDNDDEQIETDATGNNIISDLITESAIV